jgi:hypothetical protein
MTARRRLSLIGLECRLFWKLLDLDEVFDPQHGLVSPGGEDNQAHSCRHLGNVIRSEHPIPKVIQHNHIYSHEHRI